MKIRKIRITLGYVLILILASCSSIDKSLIPSYNKGGYRISIANFETGNLTGRIVDVENGEPLSNSEIMIGCFKVITSFDGIYSIKTKDLSSTFYIKAQSIGYKTVETEFFKLNKEDGMRIDFYLVEDDRPLINCE